MVDPMSLRAVCLSLLVGCAHAVAIPTSPPVTFPARAMNQPELSPALRAALVQQAKTHGFRLGHPSAPALVQTTSGPRLLFLRSKGATDPVQGLYEVDPTTGRETELVKPEALTREGELSAEEKARRERQRIAAKGFVAFSASPDGSRVLLPFAGKLFLYERASQTAHEIAGSEGALDPQFSADGQTVGFVKDHDVWLADLKSGRSHPLTKGGTEEQPHGEAEFAAQEEFARSRGFFFSADGNTVAVQYTDQSKVERLSLADPARPEKPPERPYYPRAGTENAVVGYRLVDTKTGQSKEVKWDRARFPYVAVARWDAHGPFVLYVLDRAQREGRLLAVAASGETKPLVVEKDAAWLNVDPTLPRFLVDGSFLWASEQTGEWELALHAPDGARRRTLLKNYRSLVGLDEHVAVVNGGDEPSEGVVWSVPLGGGEPKPLAQQSGHLLEARAMGVGYTMMVDLSLDAWPKYFLQGADEKRVPIATTFGTPPALPQVRSFVLGPQKVRAFVVLPSDLKPGEKLPLVDAAYGGPHVNLAVKSAFSFIRAQWMADAVHAVVVILDAPGTPLRGRAYERPLYGKLGEVPLAGHKAALEELAKVVPEADVSRVGIYGWSFGGYLSALAVLREPGFFKAAMAGAPPADWRDYDTAYTERYLGLPGADQAFYDDASLLTWASKKGASSPLLLVHGTADDNVYFLNSLKLADAMTRAGKSYEFMPLANITHMLWDEERYVGTWSRTAQFFREHL